MQAASLRLSSFFVTAVLPQAGSLRYEICCGLPTLRPIEIAIPVQHRKPTLLFFAGTDTEVGKTYVAALVARLLHESGKRVGVYKPVASGCLEKDGKRVAEDAVQLWQAAGTPRTLHDVCPQRFLAPLAPPEAAALENTKVDTELLVRGADVWRDGFDVMIVEGAGGLFSPLADGMLNIDLARQLESDVVLVAANRLGVIHQVLSCCEAASHRGIKIVGIILCDSAGLPEQSQATNAEQIQSFCDVPIIASVTHNGGPNEVAEIQKLI